MSNVFLELVFNDSIITINENKIMGIHYDLATNILNIGFDADSAPLQLTLSLETYEEFRRLLSIKGTISDS